LTRDPETIALRRLAFSKDDMRRPHLQITRQSSLTLRQIAALARGGAGD